MTVEDWQKVLQAVTQNLKDRNIPPGYRPAGIGDKREENIAGSNYITYRYEDEKTHKSVWPPHDPCVNIRIDVPAQIDIPVLPLATSKREEVEGKGKEHKLQGL